MIKCWLYETVGAEQKNGIQIDRSPLESFDFVLNESRPFGENIYSQFLEKVCEIVFVDPMHVRKMGEQVALHNLNAYIKVALMLLKNSGNGIYTDVRDMKCSWQESEKSWEIFDRIEEYLKVFAQYDLLIAYDVHFISEFPYFINNGFWINAEEIENFPVKGKRVRVKLRWDNSSEKGILVARWGKDFQLYQACDGYYCLGNVFASFRYNWQKELPNIKRKIEEWYKDSRVIDRYERHGTLFDIIGKKSSFDEYLRNDPVINHIPFLVKTETECRKIALLYVNYMTYGNIELETNISVKYPEIEEILSNSCTLNDKIAMRFFLAIDVEELVTSVEDFKHTWFGCWACKNYIELFGKDEALLEFSRQIPGILENMEEFGNTDMKGFWESFHTENEGVE